MLHVGPCITPLHFYLETCATAFSGLRTQKMLKSFFRGNSAACGTIYFKYRPQYSSSEGGCACSANSLLTYIFLSRRISCKFHILHVNNFSQFSQIAGPLKLRAQVTPPPPPPPPTTHYPNTDLATSSRLMRVIN